MIETYWTIALGVLVVAGLIGWFIRAETTQNRQSKDRSDVQTASVRAKTAADAADRISSTDYDRTI